MKTLIIAEAGSCHEGVLDKALRLVDVAKEADADIVKFQYWSSADRMAERRHAPEYREKYVRGQLPAEWLPLLKSRADEVALEFMCSTYLPEDIGVVDPFVNRFKISSFERGDWEFIAAHARFRKPLIISCGLQDNRGYGMPPDATYLHCVSAYPVPIDQLNIARVRDMVGPWSPFSKTAGFSDHSASDQTWTGALAVAAGARVVERHFRLDETDPGCADFGHAMSPQGFRDYNKNIRFAEICLGTGHPKLQPCEVDMVRFKVTA